MILACLDTIPLDVAPIKHPTTSCLGQPEARISEMAKGELRGILHARSMVDRGYYEVGLLG